MERLSRFHRTLLFCGLVSSCLILFVIDVYAAQTVPTATVTPALPAEAITIDEFYTFPRTVIAGDEFEINMRFRNVSPFHLFSIEAEVSDRTNDSQLISLSGSKTLYQVDLEAGESTLDSHLMRYELAAVGAHILDFVITFSYEQNGELKTGVSKQEVTLVVTAPTPTPTLTLSPTPIPSPTISPSDLAATVVAQAELVVQQTEVAKSKTALAATTTAVAATTTAVAVAVLDITESGKAEATVTRATDGGPTSDGNMGEENSTGQETTSERAGELLPIILEFTAPSTLFPRQPFSMGIVVRNFSDSNINAALVEWQGCDAVGIAPIGGGQWYVAEVPAGGEATQLANFFVAANAIEGVYTCELQATSAAQSKLLQRTAKVYFWVQRPTLADTTPTPTSTLTPPPPPSPVVEAVEEAAAEAQETFWEWFVRLLLGR